MTSELEGAAAPLYDLGWQARWDVPQSASVVLVILQDDYPSYARLVIFVLFWRSLGCIPTMACHECTCKTENMRSEKSHIFNSSYQWPEQKVAIYTVGHIQARCALNAHSSSWVRVGHNGGDGAWGPAPLVGLHSYEKTKKFFQSMMSPSLQTNSHSKRRSESLVTS